MFVQFVQRQSSRRRVSSRSARSAIRAASRLVALDGVRLGSELADRSAADVLADDPPVDAAGAGVVTAALFPAHSVTPSRLPARPFAFDGLSGGKFIEQ